ncbi:Mitochondrial import receptor subunit TOM22-like protein [Armadillidium vulgare]|nr:Mitochondrial import receptor subunit TOM22-like protein [Armadillidium vulgare]
MLLLLPNVNVNSLIDNAQLLDDGIDSDDDDEILEESLSERLVGLTEMFPESVRIAVSKITCKTKSLCKNVYNLSRQVVWIGVSSSLILFAPVILV